MVVEKALEKDPAERYQSMRELVVDLRRLVRQTADGSRANPAAGSPAPARGLRALAVIVIAVALTVMAFVVWRSGRGTENGEPVVAVPLITLRGVQRYPSFSPDGNHVTFTWTGPSKTIPTSTSSRSAPALLCG